MKNGWACVTCATAGTRGCSVCRSQGRVSSTWHQSHLWMEEKLEELEGKLAVLCPLIRTSLLQQNKRRGTTNGKMCLSAVHVSPNVVSASLPSEPLLETVLPWLYALHWLRVTFTAALFKAENCVPIASFSTNTLFDKQTELFAVFCFRKVYFSTHFINLKNLKLTFYPV